MEDDGHHHHHAHHVVVEHELHGAGAHPDDYQDWTGKAARRKRRLRATAAALAAVDPSLGDFATDALMATDDVGNKLNYSGGGGGGGNSSSGGGGGLDPVMALTAASVVAGDILNVAPSSQKRKRVKHDSGSEHHDTGASAGAASTVPTTRPPAHEDTYLFDGKWHTFEQWKALKEKHAVREGRYTQREDKVLKKAVADFMEEYGLKPDQLEAILFRDKKDQKEDRIQLFWQRIGESLPERPLQSVYAHLRRLYHPQNYLGPYSPEEDERLLALVMEEGRKWQSISKKMGRMASNCRDRYREISVKQKNSGAWTEEENELLRSAVRAVTLGPSASVAPSPIDGPLPDRDIPWSLVAQQVGTRTHHQCRTHWYGFLNIRDKKDVDTSEKLRWSPQDEVALLDRLKEIGYDDENEVQWSYVPTGQLAAWGTTKCRERFQFLKKRVDVSLYPVFQDLIDGIRKTIPPPASVMEARIASDDL